MEFNNWLNVFLEEKNIDTSNFEIESESGLNIMPFEYVVEKIKNASSEEQKSIKNKIVQLDYQNANIRDFFKYLATILIKQRENSY